MEPELIAARVTGASMRPYLRDDDVVFFTPLEPQQVFDDGQLVVIRKNSSDDRTVHRIVGAAVKGDRVRVYDGAIGEDLEIIGLARGRMTGETVVSFESSFSKKIHELQSRLSRRNVEGVTSQKFYAACLIIIGFFGRWIENRSGA